VGNSESFETYTGPYNASFGTLLLGEGTGEFTYVPQSNSGLYLDYDQKALGMVNAGNENLVVVTNNNAAVQLLSASVASNGEFISLKANEASLEMILDTGKVERKEIGYGSGYLTQSSRGIFIPTSSIKQVNVYDFAGNQTRTIKTNQHEPN
jgi:hypothetical protein